MMSHQKSNQYSYDCHYIYNDEPDDRTFIIPNYPAGDYSDGETDDVDLLPEQKYSVQTQPSCPLERCQIMTPQQWRNHRIRHMMAGGPGGCMDGAQMDITELYRRKGSNPQHQSLLKPPLLPQPRRSERISGPRIPTTTSNVHQLYPTNNPTPKNPIPTHSCTYYQEMQVEPSHKYMRRIRQQPHDSEQSPSPPPVDYYEEDLGDVSDNAVHYDVDGVTYHHSSPQLASQHLQATPGGPGPPVNQRHSNEISSSHTRRLPSTATVMRPHSTSTTLRPPPLTDTRIPHHIPPSTHRSSHRRVPTVLAPRYYRRSAMTGSVGSSVYKRPSKLCLPLACQPDHAFMTPRKHRGNAIPPIQGHHVHVLNPQKILSNRRIPDEYDQSYYSEEYEAIPSRGEPQQPIRRPRIARNKMNLLMRHTKYGKNERYECQNDDENSTTDIDAILAHYETVLDVNDNRYEVGKMEKTSSKVLIHTKSSKGKVSSIPTLKPRVPATIKARQESSKKLQASRTSKFKLKKTDTETTTNERSQVSKSEVTDEEMVQRLDVEEVTTDVLDKLLEDLMSGGCIDKNSHDKSKILNQQLREGQKRPLTVTKNNKKDDTSGLNEQRSQKSKTTIETSSLKFSDINQIHPIKPVPSHQTSTTDTVKNMSILTTGVMNSKQSEPISKTPKIQHTLREDTNPISRVCVAEEAVTRYDSFSNTSAINDNVPTDQEDNRVALELHRSKSYIINLIDRALSKELGTSPEPRLTSKVPQKMPEIMQTSTKVSIQPEISQGNPEAIRTSNNRVPDAEICSEIAAALTESFMPKNILDTNKPSASTYLSTNEEPPYVKQLKQLRWGHLKHIQQEIRRLEDLERFLDTCSTGAPFYQPAANMK